MLSLAVVGATVGRSACVAGLLPGCQSSEKEMMDTARSRFSRHDVAGAQIILRNLLQANPSSPTGRLLFAQTLMAQGDVAAADVELARAADLQAPAAVLLPLQAELLLAQGKGTEVIERFSTQPMADDTLFAEMRTWVARAQLRASNVPAATQAIQDALARVPGHRPARQLKARLAAVGGQVAAAKAEVELLLKEDPNDAQAWLLRGELDTVSDGLAQSAIAAYRKAIELQPTIADGHAGLIVLLLREHDFLAASAAADAMRAALPRSTAAAYLQALAAFQRSDFQRARDRLQGLQLDANPRALMLSGTVAARLGDLVQAESRLARVVQMLPREPIARRELAEVYLRLGQPERALASLEPLVGDTSSTDAQAWRLAGQAHVRLGDFGAADKAYQKVRRLQPEDRQLAIVTAQLKIARGDSEAGLRELAAAAEADPKSIGADLALISAHMQGGNHTAAMAAVQALILKAPEAVEPLLIRGHLHAQAGQTDAARTSFEAALDKDPSNLAATRQLVALDLAAGQPDRARARHDKLLQRDPRAARVMLDLAELGRRLGDTRKQTAAWVDKAVQIDPNDASVWVAAVQFHLNGHDTVAALSRARAALAALPRDPDVLTVAAAAELSEGNVNQAIANLGELVRLRPRSPEAYLRQAEALNAAGKTEEGLAAAERALELAPQSATAARAVVRLAQAAQRLPRALAVARAWQQRQPESAVGWQLEAEVLLVQKQPLPAAAALRTALTKKAGGETAWLLATVLNKHGRAADAQAHIETWLREHPDDADFLDGLGALALSRGDLAEAETRYRQVLKLRPDSPEHMNNLAFVLVKRSNPDALALAERAAKAAPYSPPVLDTLAAAYASGGNAGKAVAAQELVVELAPRSLPYRLLLVQYLAAAGDKDRARDELDRARDQLGQQSAPPLMLKLQQQLRG